MSGSPRAHVLAESRNTRVWRHPRYCAIMLSHLQDDLAPRVPRFEIAQRRRQLFEREFTIDHRLDRTAVDQRGDVVQLIAVRLGEVPAIRRAGFGARGVNLSPHQPDRNADEPSRALTPREIAIRRA